MKTNVAIAEKLQAPSRVIVKYQKASDVESNVFIC